MSKYHSVVALEWPVGGTRRRLVYIWAGKGRDDYALEVLLPDAMGQPAWRKSAFADDFTDAEDLLLDMARHFGSLAGLDPLSGPR